MVKGDLFKDLDDEKNKTDFFTGYAIAHAVSEDMVMGKGIAVEFVKRFGCRKELRQQGKKVGEVAHLDGGGGDNGFPYIFYMITKKVYNGKPTYKTLEKAIQSLYKLCIELGVTRVHMPRIGCGLDRHSWPKVKLLLEKTFRSGKVDVIVHDFDHDKLHG